MLLQAVAMTTLIVDDHPAFRAFARDILIADGFEVIGEAADGRSALAAAAEFRPAVVLLDIQLPDIDGFAVARALQTHEQVPEIVLVSTREAADYGARLQDTPACGFIRKEDLSGTAVSALLAGTG